MANSGEPRPRNWLLLGSILGVVLALETGCQPSATRTGTASPSSIASSSATPAPQGPPTSARPSIGPSQLVLTGALLPHSTEQPDGCGYRSGSPRLLFGSDPMPVGKGGEVARVQFAIVLGATQTGSYNAMMPLGESGETPLQIRTTDSPTSGAASGLWQAARGTVTISDARHLGESGSYGWASGSIDALTESRDGGSVRIGGTWQCVIDWGANG